MAKRILAPAYLKKVRELPRVACGTHYGVQAHHKTGAGMGLKASDYDTFPLCADHHTMGGRGVAIHAGVPVWEEKYGTQEQHIRETQRKLNHAQPAPNHS